MMHAKARRTRFGAEVLHEHASGSPLSYVFHARMITHALYSESFVLQSNSALGTHNFEIGHKGRYR